MEKEQIAILEYGAAKNGAVISSLPSLDCLFVEWKGDILLEEGKEIMLRTKEEIVRCGFSKMISDTSELGAIPEELTQWSEEFWTPQVIEAGLKKSALKLPNNIAGEIMLQEIIDNLQEKTQGLAYFYTNHLEEAFEWIEKEE
jgi:hypothetical protein